MQDRHGPQRTGRFQVEIDDVPIEGWREVDLPSQTTEVGEYREGDDPDHEKKLWGQTRLGTLTMERGVQPGDTRIWDWSQNVAQGRVDEGRKELAIILLDEEGQPQIRWEFTNAWIQHYEPPKLDASADGEIPMERIVVAFDRMTREEL